MAEKGDDNVLKDLPELGKLMSEQDKKLESCESSLRQWRRYRDDYRALRERLATLQDRVSHEVTVPLGPLAFAPGRLVHTNELLVLLGDNWFAKTSAHSACGIVDRRLEHCDKMVSEVEKERDLFTKWREQTAALQEDVGAGVAEIAEPLDEDEETKWREDHRRRVAEQKRREAELRREAADQTDLMARLDALEKLEELRDEMDRLSDDDGGGAAASAADADSDSDSDSDSDGSVIIRASPEPEPLDSDDSAEPEPEPIPWAEPEPERERRAGAGLRKRVSFSGAPGVNRVHLYDADAPAHPAAAGEPPGPTAEPASPPASILKPTEGAPPIVLPGVDGEGEGAGERAPWLAAPESVPIQPDEEEEPLPPQHPPPERPDLSKVFSYKIEERDTAGATAVPPAAPAPAPAPAETAPRRPVSRFKASRSKV